MRFPSECCPIYRTLRQTVPNLAETQSNGLALWTFGTVTAQSGRLDPVSAALTFAGQYSDSTGEADARAQAGFGSGQVIHRARNGVQSVVETVAGECNRYLGRGSCRAVDRIDRPRAVEGGGVAARVSLLYRNGIQCAEKRGTAAAESPGQSHLIDFGISSAVEYR